MKLQYLTLVLTAAALLTSGCTTTADAVITPVAPEVSTVAPTPAPTPAPKPWADSDIELLAKMLWGEARGVPSQTEQAACVWVVLNRVDSYGSNIADVVTARYAFSGYRKSNPVDPTLKALCEDVVERWYAEKDGVTDSGRVLPADYLYFSGDGKRNHFRNAYRGGTRWNWTLESPYET